MGLSETVYDFLEINRNLIYDLEPHKIISLIVNSFEISMDHATEFFYRWKAEKLGVKYNGKNLSLNNRVKKTRLIKTDDGDVIGQNGIYTKFDNGLLLTRKKGYVFFEDKREAIKFFNEIMDAFEIYENHNEGC